MHVVGTLEARVAVRGRAVDCLTTMARYGGYDLVVSSVISALDGFELESAYVGSFSAGYRGMHLVLARAGHSFAGTTELSPASGPDWWRQALLDHFAVLQEQLTADGEDAASVEVSPESLAALRR